MGFFDRFRKKETVGTVVDPTVDLVLGKMRPGFLVDYDLKTWKVTAYNVYDFQEADRVEEWELTLGREKRYLERSEDDGEEWTLARKIPIGALSKDVRKYIMEHDDPPHQVDYQGTTFYLESSYAGYFRPGGDGPRQEMIRWEFCDDDESRFLTIEQWSETEFEASVSETVEDYQFTHILPGPSDG